jgi:hypothetical protein
MKPYRISVARRKNEKERRTGPPRPLRTGNGCGCWFGLCKNERQRMSQKSRGSITSVERKPPPPVKVRLKRLNCNEAVPYPPDGQAREWWQRLRSAFGTASSAFVQASLYQLIAAARLPGSGISEIAVNASLALIEGAKPQGEIEAALVLQMACTHAAAMAVLATFAGGHGPDRSMAVRASAAGRLLRAYATHDVSETAALKSCASSMCM